MKVILGEYKDTSLGQIPINWECVVLDEVAERATGHTPDKKKPHYWNGGIKWVSLADSNCLDNPVIDETAKNISEQGIENSSARCLPKGTVILLRDAAVGRVSILGERMAVSQHFVAWITGNKLFNRYLYYHLYGRKHEFQRIAVGSTIVTIGMGYFAKMKVLLPPLAEQEKIAEILGCWDSGIERLEKLIAAKRKQKKGLMQQLLTGKNRFKEFVTSKETQEYHFYVLPKDWCNVKVSEIAKETTKRHDGSDVIVLSCSKYDGLVNSLDYFGKKVYSDDTSNYKVVKAAQFAYPSNHIEEGSIGLLRHIDYGIVSPIYTVFQTKEKVEPEFLYALFKTELYRHIFSVNTNASVDRRGSLRWKEFSNICVPLPSLAEQQKIASVLNAADQEIDHLSDMLKALKSQKKGLMQKLLTGKIRVKV